ncbi:MAG TPA: TIGR01457 family HAD-type hydrolase, partial [Arthrobacter bacterium]|nr:TIGR01457 family HAD-type hydrolase [Arthrobacter sp.]
MEHSSPSEVNVAEADQVQGSPAVYRSGQEIECWLTDMDGVLVHEN